MLRNLLDIAVDPIDTYWTYDPSVSSFFAYLGTILIFFIIGLAILTATITVFIVLARRRKRKNQNLNKELPIQKTEEEQPDDKEETQ